MNRENVVFVDFAKRESVTCAEEIELTLPQRRAKRRNAKIHETLGTMGVELPAFREAVKEIRTLNNIIDDDGRPAFPGLIDESIMYAHDNFSPHQLQEMQRSITTKAGV